MDSKNTIGVIFLVIILLTFSVGGYFLMQYMTEENSIKENKEYETISDLRIDKTKDYIYYENGTHAIQSEEIHFEDAVLNFTTQQEINLLLKNEMDAMRNSIKYIDEQNVLPEGVTANDENIYSLNFREYKDYQFKDYVSLVIMDYEYIVGNNINPIKLNSYVIDKKTGVRITSDTLLSENNITLDQVKEKVRARLNDTQVLNGDSNVIDIEGTLNSFDNYTIYINKNGKLEVTFVVKSLENNYNDSVEIN